MNYMLYNAIIQKSVYESNIFKYNDDYLVFIPNSDEFVYNNIRGDVIVNNSNIKKRFNILYNETTGEQVKLNGSIVFNIEIDENGFYYSSDKYNIYTFGKTQQEAENNLLEDFLVQYDSYALEDDDILDANSKILKKDLLSIYGEYDA